MTADPFQLGIRCWFTDIDEAWVSAELVERQTVGDSVKLVFKDDQNKEHLVEASVASLSDSSNTSLPPFRNPPVLENTEDLTNLSYLKFVVQDCEFPLIQLVSPRYCTQFARDMRNYRYTLILNVSLYSHDIVQAYASKRRGELEPHVFAIAEDAYRCMLRDGTNQTIIVSGESGAGKTVSAKYIMRYFATVDDPEKPRKRKIVNGIKSGMSHTEEAILATNPIMEAFGNAKTTRNDNSSRFGKYIEILFDKDADIVGAKIKTYLLERSRLAFQPATERNYHIFYQLCAGASEEESQAFGLGKADTFHYLNQGRETQILNVDDAAEFQATRNSLKIIGVSTSTQNQLWKLLAALLHLGNVNIQASRTDAVLSCTDPSLQIACALLGVDPTSFAKWTIKKQIVTRSEKIQTNLNQKQAIVVRDSVAKFVYACLFDWLVENINQKLAKEDVVSNVNSFIGVLDIYGFEHFEKNSFEQFCINYANEKLQQEFNQHVFKLEQEEYLREEINWQMIDYADNQPCINLIEGKLGVLSLLDEECRLPSGTDDSYTQKLYNNFGGANHEKFFKKPRFNKSAFTIVHYALEVTYETDGFLEKNKDTVPEEHLALLSASSNVFLTQVIQTSQVSVIAAQKGGDAGTRKTGTLPKKPTLGAIFKSSLIQLMDTIDKTNAHYIRCIKPNDAKVAWDLEPNMVVGQLRACGVLETIRISCAGFPSRWTFAEFVERYFMLVDSSSWAQDIKELCMHILHRTIPDTDKYQLGLSKIFFRPGMLAHLERVRAERLNSCATIIQRNMLRHMLQKRYRRLRRDVIWLQSVIRGAFARRELARISKEKIHAINVQTFCRGFISRRAYKEARLVKAIIKVQAAWRSFIQRKTYKKNVRSVVLVQSCWRRRAAKQELDILRSEAKSANHFKEVSYQLENKVIELTQSLTTRTQENKALAAQLHLLEVQSSSWRTNVVILEDKNRVLEADLMTAHVSLAKGSQLEEELQSLQQQLKDSKLHFKDLDMESQNLRESLSQKSKQLEEAQVQSNEHRSHQINLQKELDLMKSEVHKSSMLGITNGTPNGEQAGRLLGPAASLNNNSGLFNSTARKRSKRHSYVSPFSGEDVEDDEFALALKANFSPRPASMAAVLSDGVQQRSASGASFDYSLAIENVEEEIMKILEDDDLMNNEIMYGLIQSLKIPQPSLQTPPEETEVLFPARLMNLITSEMWKFGYIKESERFLANVMQSIQQQVMTYEGEEAIVPGVFWLSNVHEILSFVFIAENDILHGTTEIPDLEWQEYDHLITIVKHDLESLEFNIYHTWMKELKKRLAKMIIPAIIESQSLPGFITHESNRFFNKLLQGNGPQFSMDDLLNLFNKVYKAMKSFYLEESVVQQVITELLKLVGVTAFNDLLMRRNFLSWKRGLQINYNITRIEEWCKSHDMPEGTLQLEHLMQATKLLQLKKATIADIDILYDICWCLSNRQIHKLINQYYPADYEPPIIPEILKAVASRVTQEEPQDILLDAVSLDDSGTFEIAQARNITNLDNVHIPGYLSLIRVKHLLKLVDLEQNAMDEIHES